MKTPVFDMGVRVDPPEVAQLGLEKARAEGIDVVIIDTAGRLQVDVHLMEELRPPRLHTAADEILLVVDAMTG